MNDLNQQYPLCEREHAIKNMGGMVWLYEKHLCKFKLTYADSYCKTQDYLLCGNTGDARILIHTVKGLAGTLGFRRLYYAAAELEQAIILSSPSLNTALILFKNTLQEVMSLPEKD